MVLLQVSWSTMGSNLRSSAPKLGILLIGVCGQIKHVFVATRKDDANILKKYYWDRHCACIMIICSSKWTHGREWKMLWMVFPVSSWLLPITLAGNKSQPQKLEFTYFVSSTLIVNKSQIFSKYRHVRSMTAKFCSMNSVGTFSLYSLYPQNKHILYNTDTCISGTYHL